MDKLPCGEDAAPCLRRGCWWGAGVAEKRWQNVGHISLPPTHAGSGVHRSSEEAEPCPVLKASENHGPAGAVCCPPTRRCGAPGAAAGGTWPGPGRADRHLPCSPPPSPSHLYTHVNRFLFYFLFLFFPKKDAVQIKGSKQEKN